MLDEAVVFLLTLMVLSHLFLQQHCFTARKSLPGVLRAVEDRLEALLGTADDRASTMARSVEEGVELLAEVADALSATADAPGAAPGSPFASLLTGLLMPGTSMGGHGRTTEPEWAVHEVNHDEASQVA